MRSVYIDSQNTLDSMPRPIDGLEGGSVVALGFFDGVHAAHRELLKRAGAHARRLGLPLCVFTFSGASSIKKTALRIYTDAEREELLCALGVDVALSFDFEAVKGVSAERFVSDILLSLFSAKVAVCGYNFRFGKGALGNAELLSSLLSKAGAECEIIPEYRLRGEEVSSTRIRALIESGDLFGAAQLLGEPYFVSGVVERGMGIGEGMGIPTVNTDIPTSRLSVGLGVYATAARLGDKIYPAVTNVGVCPTFGERGAHLETHIIGFNGDIYGENVRVYFLERLRDEKRFDSEKELIMQINIDKNKALKIIGEEKWLELGLKLQ